jgi:hypothetical protein
MKCGVCEKICNCKPPTYTVPKGFTAKITMVTIGIIPVKKGKKK